MDKRPLLILSGPTAVGKTKTSIYLAKKLNGEIISADSMQVYKMMDIGTAKITAAEMDGIRHHMIDIMMTDEEKLLGVTETAEKKLLKTTIFTDACQWEIRTEGKENKSIENGNILENILPYSEKQKLLEGQIEINYNGLVIKRLTGIKPPKAEVKEEKEEVKEVVKPKAKTVRKKK